MDGRLKKFKLTNTMIERFGARLFQIQAIRDFKNVKKDDLGGFVSSENNLSHEGTCWIKHSAYACGASLVSGNAEISENVAISGKAHIYGEAIVFGQATVSDDGKVCDNAVIGGNAHILLNAKICNNAKVFGTVNSDVTIDGTLVVPEGMTIYEASEVSELRMQMGKNEIDNYLNSTPIRMFTLSNEEYAKHIQTILNIAGEQEERFISSFHLDKKIAQIMIKQGFDKEDVAKGIASRSMTSGERSDRQREYGKRIVKEAIKDMGMRICEHYQKDNVFKAIGKIFSGQGR